jgi:D-alanine-D-alanine ligase
MSSLARELPAHIPSKLQKEIIDIALKVFRIVRAKGLIRIDFMVVANKVYVTEVNPIPGSMSYYLWEASGVSFKNQITDLIQQSFVDAQSQNAKHISYSTDIVSKFINNRDR